MINPSKLSEEFKNNGYIVIESYIDYFKIENVLLGLESFAEHKKVFYTQSTHRYINAIKDKNGFIPESMEGVCLQYNAGKLGESINKILLGEEINYLLKSLFPEYNRFVQKQHMLFDKSISTIDHIDSYYLDTFPKGFLVGVWVALEDISPYSGPFRVYPKSHVSINPYELDKLNHEDFKKRINIFKNNFDVKELHLKKGSVVIWDSRLIHGASKIKNHNFSRKSLTGHYYPMNMQTQQKLIYQSPINTTRKIINEILFKPRLLSRKHKIYSQYSFNHELLINLRVLINSIKLNLNKNKKPGKVSVDMRG